MATAQTIYERVFAQVETAYGIAPNSSGTSTLAGGDYMRMTRFNINPAQARIPSSDKTGSPSATLGAIGARTCTWDGDCEVRPSGAAGTPPDCDPLLQTVFGAAPVIVAGTSARYNMASAIKSATLFKFRQPASMMQQAAICAVTRELVVTFDQQANSHFQFRGDALWGPDSKTFPGLDAVGKGGLTALPGEPASPVFAGLPVNSLLGSALIDGGSTFKIRGATVRIDTGIVIPSDRLFAGQYGSDPERDTVTVTLDLNIFDEDTAACTALYQKALAGTPIDCTLTLGNLAGSMVEIGLNDCQLPMPSLDDSARKWVSNLQGIRAYATGLTSLDECYFKFF